jgi:uncharacterized protein (DUF58 family)
MDRVRDASQVAALRRRTAAIWDRIGLTRVGQVALVASVIPWIAARIVAGTTLYILAYGTVAVVATATFLAPRRLKITADRTGLFPRVQKGDRLEVRITVAAERGLSSFQLEEHIPERLGTPLRVPVARVSAGQAFEYTYSLNCAQRGVYTIGPLVAITQDPIGVSQRRTVLAESFELLVHPRISRVSDRPLTRLYEDPPLRPPVSKPWPSGMEFYGMREYRPGDDLRRIVWRASARTQTLMVSEAEQGITDHITLILDTDRGSHSREGDISESFEYAVEACASLGVRHLVEGYEVRVEANSGPLTRSMRGGDRSMPYLDVMSRVDTDREPLSSVLRRLVNDPRRDAHTILITPKLHAIDAALLKLLIDKGVSVTLIGVVWNEEDAHSLSQAAALGAHVTPVQVGDDLAAALTHEVRIGRHM